MRINNFVHIGNLLGGETLMTTFIGTFLLYHIRYRELDPNYDFVHTSSDARGGMVFLVI